MARSLMPGDMVVSSVGRWRGGALTPSRGAPGIGLVVAVEREIPLQLTGTIDDWSLTKWTWHVIIGGALVAVREVSSLRLVHQVDRPEV